MSEGKANQNVEVVVQGLLNFAEQLRQKATVALTDKNLSDGDRAEITEELEQTLELVDARVRWWKTGEGPAL